MNAHLVTDTIAFCAVVAQLFVVFSAVCLGMARIGIPTGRRWLNDLRVIVNTNGLWLAFAVAAVATLGSLYFSEVRHFVPCTLCWYQRIAMYPLAPILLIAALRRDRGIRIYAIVLASLGLLISIYHVIIEQWPSLESKSCSPLVPCTIKWTNVWGYLTIPRMALTAFATLLTLMLLLRLNELPS